MSSARLIVCEKTGVWATAMRRTMSGSGYRVHEVRSLAQCFDALADHPASFVTLELTAANRELIPRAIVRMGIQYPAARAIVVGERGLEGGQWLLREAGAIDVLFSPRQISAAGRLAGRHLAAVPEEEMTLRDLIWSRIPWSNL